MIRCPKSITLLTGVLMMLAVPVSAQVRGNAGQATGNPIASLEARMSELEALVASLQSGGNTLDPAQLVGTWIGSRFVGGTGTPATITEEPGQTFTFHADGTFTSANFFRASAEYRILRNTILVGPIPFQDAHIAEDTLSFYTDYKTNNVGGGISSQGTIYILQRQP